MTQRAVSPQWDDEQREPVAVRRARLLRLAAPPEAIAADDQLCRADRRVHRCSYCGEWRYGTQPCSTGCDN